MAGEQGEQRDPTWITRPEGADDNAAEGARLDGFVSAFPPSPDFSEESGLRDPEIRATRLAQLAAAKMGEANSYTIDDAKVLAVLALQAQMEALTGVLRSLPRDLLDLLERDGESSVLTPGERLAAQAERDRIVAERRLTFDQEESHAAVTAAAEAAVSAPARAAAEAHDADDLIRYCAEHGKRSQDGWGASHGKDICNAIVRRESGIPILCGLTVTLFPVIHNEDGGLPGDPDTAF